MTYPNYTTICEQIRAIAERLQLNSPDWLLRQGLVDLDPTQPITYRIHRVSSVSRWQRVDGFSRSAWAHLDLCVPWDRPCLRP